MSLTTYSNENVSTTKQLNKAVKDVFSRIADRNEQIQQLLVLSVQEAAKESGGQITNNLSWLSNIIARADDTKGVNAKRITRYIVSVLCKDTVSYSSETKQLSKKKSKEVKLSYDLEPAQEWYTFEKAKDSAKAAFNYGSKRVTNVVIAALDPEKGGLTAAELMEAVVASEKVSIAELMRAMENVNQPLREAA